MRKTSVKGMGVAVAITAVVALAACDPGARAVPPASDRVVKAKQNDTITITANCTDTTQIDVDVDKWVVDMKPNGDVTFVVSPTSSADAVVTIEQKTADQWPFAEAPPFNPGNGNGNGPKGGKAKSAKGEYHYNLRVVCGTAPNSRTVLIDPDIFVD
jgi:uncharacterized membrane protein